MTSGAARHPRRTVSDRTTPGAGRHEATRSLRVTEVESIEDLRAASALLEAIWGRAEEGVPVGSEVMKSLVHAGGCVTVARDGDGALLGAAVLSPAAPAGGAYSLIAGVAPGSGDRGIGRALKLRQRAWALSHGFTSITWTFDPLVARNARFNLARLGAVAAEYEQSFYGRMSDELNGDDDADRLAARWDLASDRVTAAVAGTSADPAGPNAAAEVLRAAPDGVALLARDATGLWCRVPADVVELRRSHPRQASHWRLAVREAFLAAFAEGYAATHATRTGWYLFTDGDDEGRRMKTGEVNR